MLSFFSKIFVIIFVIAAFIIIIPNPIRNRFPDWIKTYQDYKDPQYNRILEIDQLEIMTEDPLACYKSSDCILVLCGKTPNCHSISLNQEYLDKHDSDLPLRYRCPSETDLDPNDCGQETRFDLYATCEEGQCVKKYLLPTPTPTPVNIIEKALYQ